MLKRCLASIMLLLMLVLAGCRKGGTDLSIFKNNNDYIVNQYDLKQPGQLASTSLVMIDYTKLSDDSMLNRVLMTDRGIITTVEGKYSLSDSSFTSSSEGSTDKEPDNLLSKSIQANKLWGKPWTGNATITKTFGMQVDGTMSNHMTLEKVGDLLAIGDGDVISFKSNELIVKYSDKQSLSATEYGMVSDDLDKVIADSANGGSNWKHNPKMVEAYYRLVDNEMLKPVIIRAQNEQVMFNLPSYYGKMQKHIIDMETKMSTEAVILGMYMSNRLPNGWDKTTEFDGRWGGSPKLTGYSSTNKMTAQQLFDWVKNDPNNIWTYPGHHPLFRHALEYFRTHDVSKVSLPTAEECKLSGDELLHVPFFRHSIDTILTGEVSGFGGFDKLTYDNYKLLNAGDSGTYSWGVMQFNANGGNAYVIWKRIKELLDPNMLNQDAIGSGNATYVKYTIHSGKLEVSEGSKLTKGSVIAKSVLAVDISAVVLGNNVELSSSSWVSSSPSNGTAVDFVYSVLVLGNSSTWNNLYKTTLVVEKEYSIAYSGASEEVKSVNIGRCVLPDTWGDK